MAANGEGQTIQTDKKKKQKQDVAWLLRVRKSRKQMVYRKYMYHSHMYKQMIGNRSPAILRGRGWIHPF
jgi:hypothetical protein